jgi:hypothetical protein
MDQDEDVPLLVMSSHGTSGASGGFALQLPDGSMQMLTPHELKSMLDGEGSKNRVDEMRHQGRVPPGFAPPLLAPDQRQ